MLCLRDFFPSQNENPLAEAVAGSAGLTASAARRRSCAAEAEVATFLKGAEGGVGCKRLGFWLVSGWLYVENGSFSVGFLVFLLVVLLVVWWVSQRCTGFLVPFLGFLMVL